LTTAASEAEIAEWKAINDAYSGWEYHARLLDFIRVMRKKHPDMPVGIEEQVHLGAERLKHDKELARRENIAEQIMQDLPKYGSRSAHSHKRRASVNSLIVGFSSCSSVRACSSPSTSEYSR
jgi:hypothetical protein